MKIIQPAHNKPAIPVKNWKEIRVEAQALREFVHAGKFIGNYDRAYAISHAQVSEEPKTFFVINEDVEKGRLKKLFGSWCVINLRIVQFGDPVYLEEGCMSWPYRQTKRIDRMNKITVEYYIPFLWTWRKIKRKFIGLPAFICQHETEHGIGKNIYGK